MSAFLLNDISLNTLAACIVKQANEGETDWQYSRTNRTAAEILKTITHNIPINGEPTRLLTLSLYDLNSKSIGIRYPDTADTDNDLQYVEPAIIDHVQLVKLTNCFLYQCLEGDIDTTKLYKAVEKFRDALCYDMVTSSDAYDQAEWGL